MIVIFLVIVINTHGLSSSSIKRARELGDYIIIGVFSDSDVNKYRGSNFPILNLNERVLSVLGCKVNKTTSISTVDLVV